MELSKKAILDTRFTTVKRKYYLAEEVDQFLDALADAAEQSQQQNQRELSQLREQAARLQRQVDESAAMDPSVSIRQANQKAREILNEAMRESDSILMDITSQRNRVIAASRTAYYNALQFKQELAQQFRQMEQDMDSAIDVLRILENVQSFGTLPTAASDGKMDALEGKQ